MQVQVIPWVLADSNFVRSPSQRLDPSKTVFVGALHGMLNAEALAAVMCDLFGGVVYAGIDTDKHKYPIGKGWSHWGWCSPLPCSEEAAVCPWLVLLLEDCPGARLGEQMLSNPFCSLCFSSPGPGEARAALGRADRADVLGNWKVLDHSRAA